MATIRDVARHAGVSTATVSRVFSRPDAVADDTRKGVLKSVETLGYTPNSAAKSLRTHRSGKLLVTVPDIANPFFALILQGIEGAAQRAGYAVLFGDTQHDDIRENRYAQMLQRREADGLIFLGHRLPKAAAALVRTATESRAPVVNGCEFSPRLGVPSVHIDNARAAGQAMAHLFSLGHRRIGIVTGPLVSPLSRDRLAGAMRRARAQSRKVELTVTHGDFSIESGIAAAERLLDGQAPPTAIFCFNDEMAMGVLHVSRRRGLRVPEAMSVMGFDDIRFAQYADPPLTTIRQPMRELGEATVRLLLDIIDGHMGEPVSVTLPHALIVRASTGPAPVRVRVPARRPVRGGHRATPSAR
ncbi:MAG: LacI family transcriptional regulator [Vicinamibacteraceae bacterium]|nr:LacI family transcriptional regulator [Vicinamibacteraceae bacterium]